MKRFKALIIAALMLSLLSGCSGRTASSHADTTMSEHEQAAVIESLKSEWLPQADFDEWYYAITDLDHNGRCEVICASLQGTGLYTYIDIYELSEDYSSLLPVSIDVGEGESLIDIMVNSCKCYYDETADRYYYIFSDIIRNGMTEGFNYTEALSLKDGAVSIEILASSHTTADSSANAVTVYSLPDGSEISEEEFNSAAAERFTGCTETEYELNWMKAE